MTEPAPRFYDELAEWWPLFSPPGTCIVDYAFLLRETDGDVRALHDRHVEGIFPRASWLEWFAAAGLDARSDRDRWGRDVFMARRTR
jgi:hypothetical protein